MTIRNLQQFEKSLWNWAVLKDCFGDTKIKPTDLDGLVEHKANFLVLEGKASGVEIPKAQQIVFKRLSYINDLLRHKVFTVIVVWGTPGVRIDDIPTVKKIRIWPNLETEGDNEMLRTLVKTWYSSAKWPLPDRLKNQAKVTTKLPSL